MSINIFYLWISFNNDIKFSTCDSFQSILCLHFVLTISVYFQQYMNIWYLRRELYVIIEVFILVLGVAYMCVCGGVVFCLPFSFQCHSPSVWQRTSALSKQRRVCEQHPLSVSSSVHRPAVRETAVRERAGRLRRVGLGPGFPPPPWADPAFAAVRPGSCSPRGDLLDPLRGRSPTVQLLLYEQRTRPTDTRPAMWNVPKYQSKISEDNRQNK